MSSAVLKGSANRWLVQNLRMTPVVPPKTSRKVKWGCYRELCRLRNELELPFCRLKRCRRIYTRFDKLEAMLLAYLNLTLIVKIMYDLE